jgi:hypothetical protein
MPTGIYVRTAEKFLLRALHSVLNSNIKCSIAGCFNPPRGNYRTGVCEMHYIRNYRAGTYHRRYPGPRPSSHGYMYEWDRSHPLANDDGMIYQHRRVLYDKIGPGPGLRCHWCNKDVSWPSLHPDHLNSIKNDNRPENLVPSCSWCNRQRGMIRSFLMRAMENGHRPESIWQLDAPCNSRKGAS